MASSGVGETVPGVHAETELGAPPSRRRVDIGSIINSRQRDMANTELKGQVKFFEDLSKQSRPSPDRCICPAGRRSFLPLAVRKWV